MNFCQCSPIVPAMFLCAVLSWWGGVCHDKFIFVHVCWNWHDNWRQVAKPVLLAVACLAALHQHQRLVALWGWTRSPFNFWTMLGYLLLHILLQDCTFIFLEETLDLKCGMEPCWEDLWMSSLGLLLFC
jgi:hypothetical protein